MAWIGDRFDLGHSFGRRKLAYKWLNFGQKCSRQLIREVSRAPYGPHIGVDCTSLAYEVWPRSASLPDLGHFYFPLLERRRPLGPRSGRLVAATNARDWARTRAS